GLCIRIAHSRSSTRRIRGLKAEKLDLAGLWNGVRVVHGIALEEGLQIGVGRIDGVLDVRSGDDSVVELHLGPGLQILGANSAVGNADAASNQRLQPLQLNVRLYLGLELRHRQAEGRLDKVNVLILANECAAGKQILGVRTMLEKVPQIVVGDLQAETVGLMLQDGALYLNRARALHNELQIKLGQLLLLHLLLGSTLHIQRLDGGRLPDDAAKDTWTVHGREDAGIVGGTVIEDSRYKGDDHGD